MAAGTARRRLSALVIVGVLAGCDNVSWGGASIALEPPPDPEAEAPPEPDSATVAAPRVELPSGPVLYVGERSGSLVRLTPFAEVSGDSLLPMPVDGSDPAVVDLFQEAFTDSLLATGTEFTLFAEGTRVGSVRVETVERDESFCTPRPAAVGHLEVIPQAASADRFLAAPRGAIEGATYDDYADVEHVRTERVASLDFAGAVITEVGARWPSDVLAARRDVQAFEISPGGDRAFAATFLFRDQLGVREADPEAWSIFLVGRQADQGYRRAFEVHRSVARDGRGVPVLFQQMDWNGDDVNDLVLEVQGETARWVGALWTRTGEWVELFEEPCAVAPPEGR